MLLYFLLGTTLSLVTGASIEMFTEPNYIGLIPYGTLFTGWRENPVACYNFPEATAQTLSSFKANEHCVLFYDQEDCSGSSIKLDEDVIDLSKLNGSRTQDDFDNRAVSMQACSDQEGGAKVNVNFYSDPGYTGQNSQFSDVCQCTALPLDKANFASVDNHHQCVVLYESDSCSTSSGLNETIFAGRSNISANFTESNLFGKVKSFHPCQTPPHCIKLSATIFGYDLFADPYNNPSQSSISLAGKSTFYNNGSASVSQKYSPKKKILEVTEIDKITFDKRVSSWSVESKTKFSVDLQIGTGSINLFGMDLPLGSAYGDSCESEKINEAKSYVYEKSPEYTVTQIIQVPACSWYEAESMIKVVENFSVNYKVWFSLTGVAQGNQQMTAEQLIDEVGRIEDYTYNYTIDGTTIAVYATSTIQASFGIETNVFGTGGKIPLCF